MRIRRCAVAWLEPREVAHFELGNLLGGGTGVVSRLAWFVHAPHLAAPVEVAAAYAPVIGALSPVDWIDRAEAEACWGCQPVQALIDAGLVIQQREAGEADAAFRHQGWYPAAAVAHAACRWQGIDAMTIMAEQDLDTNAGLLRRHGPPPPHAVPSSRPETEIALPRVARDAFDDLLDTRATCRNYDTAAQVPLATFSQLMARVFGARGIARPTAGFEVFKRTSPSGGALHPTDCHLIVQRVEGIAPGLYRYRIDTHALEPVAPAVSPPQPGDVGVRAATADRASRAWTPAELRAFARIAVAGQDYFADAAVLCVLAPRFHRNFWKYRNHAKAYRVCVLDVGHLSQTLQLCATQAGLGPFVTGAINEVDLERAFGMTGYAQSPLVVCGFGLRAAVPVESEFDPRRKVWPR